MKFLIDFTSEASPADINAYFEQHHCTILKVWNNFDKIYLVEADSIPPATDITERVVEDGTLSITPLDVDPYFCTHRDPSIPDVLIKINEDKDWWKNYSLGKPEFDKEETTIKRVGKGVNVYIVDSGIEATHPEFAEADITNIYSVTPGDFSDNKGHGTAIASVIAGATCGVTAAKLKIVKIFDPNHTTTEHEFLDALDAIIDDHVDNTYSVLNASWIIAKNEWVEHKLRKLEDEGVFIVAAAGNSGMPIDNVTPASMLDAITVGAYNQELVPCDFSNFTGGSMISVTGDVTNYGELDGWAPGENIWAAGLNGSYGFVAGTSIAAAITSAILATNLTCQMDKYTGQRMLGFESAKFSTAMIGSNQMVFKRHGLLDLSDPKYQHSANLIATFLDRENYTLYQAPDELLSPFRIGKAAHGIRIYEPTFTKSIDWIIPLPQNFTVIDDGRLYGRPDVTQGPGPGELYKTFVSKFIRTSLDDTQETITVSIAVMPENFEPQTLPSDDPVKITLAGFCDGLATFGCNFNGGACLDFCQVSCCGFNSNKNTADCICQG